jgi:hypothetical protein
VPRRTLRTAVLAATAAAASAVLGLGTLVPAHADDTPPPVAVDDTVTVQGQGGELGGVSFVDVLANDSAPSGQDLEICRVEAPRRGLSVAEVAPDGSFMIDSPTSGIGVGGGGDAPADARETLAVLPWRNRAGTYEVTYWACDEVHLTPATVTVTVERTPEVTVTKTERPGRLRFANPRKTRVVVLYGGPRQESPDGRVGLAPGAREVRKVERRTILWIAFSPRTGETVGSGVVRGIKVPGGGFGPEPDPRVVARTLETWRTA